ncbi:MAG: TetR/AcrR family transcriptional regulator [Solirubrobacterales bacterium]|nr:TetR/AcrR family transcriptional regulator [Solirubrobacterales bacterium]
MPRSSKSQADATRTAILGRATALGSIEGLEALSIGRLADDLGLSKSGVIGPFRSKENLQLAAVEAAIASFTREVWEPAAAQTPGLTRLGAIMDAWLSYLEREVFPGGCFLTAASLEFDDRPGAVRELLAAAWQRWSGVIEREVATAQAQEELCETLDPAQVSFQLHAYVMAGNWAKQLFGDADSLRGSRAAVERLLAPSAAEDLRE